MADALLATALKESLGANARDVSPPNLAVSVEIPDSPGFDLLSRFYGAGLRASGVSIRSQGASRHTWETSTRP